MIVYCLKDTIQLELLNSFGSVNTIIQSTANDYEETDHFTKFKRILDFSEEFPKLKQLNVNDFL